MLEGAIEGMLATLGDVGHTRYLTAEETELDRQSSRGVYQGVGVQVREDETAGLVITRVFPDSPASEQGVLAGDIIIAVDGEDITDSPIDAIIAKIRGPEGTRVGVTVLSSIRKQADSLRSGTSRDRDFCRYLGDARQRYCLAQIDPILRALR